MNSFQIFYSRNLCDKNSFLCFLCSPPFFLSPIFLDYFYFFLPLHTISMTVLVLYRNRTDTIYIYIHAIYLYLSHIYIDTHLENYYVELTVLLWRWSSTICLLKAGDPGKLKTQEILYCNSVLFKVLRTKGASGVNDEMRSPSSGSKAGIKGYISPSSTSFVLFVSSMNWILSTHWGGRETHLYSKEQALIQMLMSSGNTLIDTPRNSV